jgi:hypothetical protein
MINIVGVVIIAFGFYAPFIGAPFAAYVPLSIIFWLGFLALLSPSKFIPETVNWNKWARSGLLANVLVCVVIRIIYFHYLVFISPIHILSELSYWISAPFSMLMGTVFPLEEIKLPNGVSSCSISFIRATTTTFVDILIYLIVGILIGKWLQTRRNKMESQANINFR